MAEADESDIYVTNLASRAPSEKVDSVAEDLINEC